MKNILQKIKMWVGNPPMFYIERGQLCEHLDFEKLDQHIFQNFRCGNFSPLFSLTPEWIRVESWGKGFLIQKARDPKQLEPLNI
jgi:hypothetical protein